MFVSRSNGSIFDRRTYVCLTILIQNYTQIQLNIPESLSGQYINIPRPMNNECKTKVYD